MLLAAGCGRSAWLTLCVTRKPTAIVSAEMRVVSVGHGFFAAVLIAAGIVFLIKGNFGVTGDGMPMDMLAHDALAYLYIAISLACGIGLFWRNTAPYAAGALLVYELLWMLVFKVPGIVLAPLSGLPYESWGETAVVVAGAWVLYAWFANAPDRKYPGFASGNNGVRVARVFYGLAMLAFGQAHFVYLNLTAPLVPGWLPWHAAWAYFFGATYLAAGIAVLIGVYARLAAALSAIQMGLFTLLVWLPVMLGGHADAGQWGEFMGSLSFTAGGWVVADSYRRLPWLARKPASIVSKTVYPL